MPIICLNIEENLIDSITLISSARIGIKIKMLKIIWRNAIMDSDANLLIVKM